MWFHNLQPNVFPVNPKNRNPLNSAKIKKVWDTHTISLDPGLATSPSSDKHYLIGYAIITEIEKQ